MHVFITGTYNIKFERATILKLYNLYWFYYNMEVHTTCASNESPPVGTISLGFPSKPSR
jgi:hypothetical protein